MTSGRQKREALQLKRLARRKARDPKARGTGLPRPPPGAVISDLGALVHDNTYGPRPLFYVDRKFTCIDCGVEEVWTADQQKWWHEVAKGKIASKAVRCRPCRRKHQAKARAARNAHIEGLVAKYGIEEAAQRLKRTVEEVEQLIDPDPKPKRRRARPGA